MRASYAARKVSPNDEPVSGTTDIPDDLALSLYRTMVLSRTLEERLRAVYAELEFRGELHLSEGQEAVAAGVVAAAGPTFAFSHHRSHALAVAKGLDLKALVAEIYGKSTGVCRGKGGHMHLTDLSKGFAISSIVGASVPLGAGYAFAAKRRKNALLSVAFTGDGALHQGAALETLNLAALWHLPLLIVVENNAIAFSTPPETYSAVQPVALRARGFGIEAYVMDGTDATAVYTLALDLAKKVRSESRPILVEFDVPRLAGHMEIIDFEDYLSAKEKEARKRHDPLTVTRDVLVRHRLLDDRREREIREAAERDVDAAIAYARASPFPEPDAAYADVG
ncbi:MAG TPA: thiamine pyrophosphate-dependent dehydrogenase E1 component subunit alpha [Thermoplasmata archaeon]|nr:thiamine pyrophosphate-dependent dehydrogenase E1 component subunit alpha [Thermoplasmata archaeon]